MPFTLLEKAPSDRTAIISYMAAMHESIFPSNIAWVISSPTFTPAFIINKNISSYRELNLLTRLPIRDRAGYFTTNQIPFPAHTDARYLLLQIHSEIC